MTTTTKQHTQALVQTASGPLAVVKWGMTTDQVELLKRTIAKGTTDDEFALFMTVAQKMGLDPFARQIHAVKRWDKDSGAQVMAIQVGIDGYRLTAVRTGEDDGQDGPYWCGEDGAWRDVWLEQHEPLAAKVLVFRKGRARPYVGVALWASYVQTTKEGNVNAMWRRHGPGQLAKCAEALAIRKAFPVECGGTHTDDELGEGAIDAEFTEVKPIATGQPAAAAQVQAQSTTPAAKPAAAAVEDKRPALTEEDVVAIIEEISQCGTAAACKVVHHNRIASARMNDAQRARLIAAYEGQLDEIKRVLAAEAEAARKP